MRMSPSRMLVRMLLVLAALTAVFTAVGCVPQDISNARSSAQPVTLVLGTPSTTLIPYSSSLATRQWGSLVFQSLVAFDTSGTPIPDLALKVPTKANGLVSEDGKVIDFVLDSKAKWHDGQPVTASDVVFTYRLLNSDAVVSADPAALRRVRSVVAVGEHRVRIELSEPNWIGTLRLFPYVLPRHSLEKSADLVSDPYWEHPIGSGPYRVLSVARRKAVTLERVGQGGLPRINCVFHNTPEEQLETWDSAGRAIWPGGTVDAIGSEKRSTVPSNRYRYWIFNMRPNSGVTSKTVRQLITSVLSTSSPTPDGPWGTKAEKRPGASGYIAAIRASGWRKNKDHLLAKGGQTMQVMFVYNIEDEADGFAVDSAIRRLRSMGVEDKRQSTFAYGDYFDPGAILPSGTWDVARVAMPEGVPLGAAWPFDSADIPSVSNPGGLNLTGLKDSKLERLSYELRTATDINDVGNLRRQVGKRLSELCVVIPDKRLKATVLSRGVDGVRASEADEFFTSSWRSWSIAGDAESAATR